ncbi:SDR family NAD(P)-dependent oxidoreductase [Corallococcus sp. ZKHCc1 1396]|uniref:SDR family NAD(P)-dependent oxidoreductase n=1 Tax=Corallococcus soli TaxID=2710757 RepID=A0ABR9PVF8_9BACT|nr:SDR family NAD(P)-dependent oxidoreductase [Corallococcus soli]MBE4751859.1 SDR family NAD(P)-dependent oxidoreductase [Corallococcus soli]
MLVQRLESQVRRVPGRTAIVFGEQQITFASLWADITALGASLAKLGVGPGTSVAALVDNRPEFITLFFAVALRGATLVPLNPASKESELIFFLRVSGASQVLTDGDHLALCERTCAQLAHRPGLITLGVEGHAAPRYETLLREGAEDAAKASGPRVEHDGPLVCLFSSGSTGKPKRVLRTQRNYLFELDGFQALTNVSAKDRVLCSIPLYHSHGIGSCILPSLCVGAPLIILEPVSSRTGEGDVLFLQKLHRMVELIRAERITLFPSIPYVLRAMAEDPELDGKALASVRLCFSSGNFLAPSVYEAFLAKFSLPIRQIYGCSEGGAVAINMAKGRKFEPPSVGRPLPGIELRLVDDEDKPVPVGTVGEVMIRSEGLTAGYADLPELTAEAFRDGFFRSGDLGVMNRDGRLTITGRKKLLIDTGGKKVDPFEVEAVLTQHPLVSEAVVLGVPVPSGNEIIKAVVVTRGPCDKAVLSAWCLEHLSDFKVPKIIELRDRIPKSPTGKILRKEMLSQASVVDELRTLMFGILRQGLAATDRERTSFQSFGIDSITIVELNAMLEEHFGPLPKTLFFEHDNFADLLDYLRKTHPERFAALVAELGANEAPAAPTPAPAAPVTAPPVVATGAPLAQAPKAEDVPSDAIAIVGISGRYPQAATLEAFWKLLAEGRDCVVEIPQERWDHTRYYDAQRGATGKTYAKWGGFLDGVDQFDAALFEVSPREAEVMDPQERLFLETAWTALEDAGYPRSAFVGGRDARNPVGVFVGVMWGEYQLLGAEDMARGQPGRSPKAHYWSIANRVSYFFNLHGPSMAVDTACSSSLTAIHLACDSLRAGECELALAGGVNLSLHPAKYLKMADDQFASSDGRCRSFGAGGDGYVPGEGVGAVVLKRLDTALRDGDPIHAVIRATAINHGGRTRGFTVPSPQAQGNVVARAFEKAGVSPETVSYIEAHGTGTSLGDPIEIRGLGFVFERATERKQFCAIGSVKSNIGHLEAAAGIAGLTKLVLQLQHGQLAPSLHAAEPNPHIDFAATPFALQRELGVWKRPTVVVDGVARELPRRAGLSSFGAGGANAHLLVEEAPRRAPPEATSGPVLVVLSARSVAQLKGSARALRDFLGAGGVKPGLRELAYTLQAGREALEERLAVVVEDVAELLRELTAVVEGTAPGARTWRGRAPVPAGQGEVSLDALPTDVEGLSALARQWAAGSRVAWASLYGAARPQRVSLPTYVFDRQSFWVRRAPETLAPVPAPRTALHPLLERFSSRLGEQRFSTRLSQDAWFLRDHRIDGERVLPAAAMLEMARAAGSLSGEGEVRALTDVSFLQPVVVPESGRELHVRLVPGAAPGSIRFEILTVADDGERLLHARGRLEVSSTEPESSVLELAAVRARARPSLTPTALYARFTEKQLAYGPTFQVVNGLWRDGDAVLALLELTPEVAGSATAFGLQPALLDGALQALQGFFDTYAETLVPVSLDRLRVLAPLGTRCFVYLTPSRDEAVRRAAGVHRHDLVLAREDGTVVATLSGVTLKAWRRETSAALGVYRAEWRAASPVGGDSASLPADTVLVEAGEGTLDALAKGRKDVLFLRAGQALPQLDGRVLQASDAEDLALLLKQWRAEGRSPSAVVLALRAEDAESETRAWARHGFDVLFALARALRELPSAAALRVLVVLPVLDGAEGVAPPFSGLAAFARTWTLERPDVRVKVLAADAAARASSAWAATLRAELAEEGDTEVLLRGDQRLTRGSSAVTPPAELEAFRARKGSVYLVTGGAGGLGLLTAGFLAEHGAGTLVLSGRSEASAIQREAFTALEAKGARVEYVRADVSVADDARRLIEELKARHGRLDGVVHSAGVLRDAFLLHKTRESAEPVLGPKVDGTVLLDVLTADQDLQFFLLYSSVTGRLGNVGQADYAFANGFQDDFAEARAREVAAGRRQGRTLAVAWPLWADGGMQPGAEALAAIREATGLVPLDTVSAFQVLSQALVSGPCAITVAKGDLGRFQEALHPRPAPGPAAATPVASSGVSDAWLRERTERYLREALAQEAGISADAIDGAVPLERYGITSIMVLALNGLLERHFGALSKTLFYEYETLHELAGYFLTRHREALGALFRDEAPAAASTSPGVSRPMPTTVVSPRVAVERAPASPDGDEPIAIIGLAGRFPKADGIDAFWDVLKAGLDCVTEVPADRWDLDGFYAPARDTVGRSYGKWGGFLDGVDCFDPLFFNISPREAELMDPNERLFLQAAWHTLEDAGYTRAGLRNERVGVFAGVMYSEYPLWNVDAPNRLRQGAPPAAVANRVSFFMDFHGPSLVVDTMCSSSLTALFLACESLHRGHATVALAGGVNLSVHPNKYLQLAHGNFLASDGRCHSFGADGDGYVPGEGVGAVLLKPLSRALADGDHIHGVLRGVSVNHGGRANGYTVPSPNAQAALIRQTLERAGVEPAAISYVEAHGTGTSLGDPIEITGLCKAFEAPEVEAAPTCAIGSVKSNVGHLEAAAGIAGLAKVLLQMKHGQLAPSLHSATLNPNIRFERTPFFVPQTLQPWASRGTPRLASLSSFGAGGSNAHALIEEHLPAEETACGDVPPVFLFSARDGERLRELVRTWVAFLDRQGPSTPVLMEQVAHALQTGREALDERLAVVCKDLGELRARLSRWVKGEAAAGEVLVGRGSREKRDLGGLLGGPTGAAFLRMLVEQREWEKLAGAWVSGAEVDWLLGRGQRMPRRLSLPVYPFARERYWVPAEVEAPAEDAASTTARLLSRLEWARVSAPAAVESVAPAALLVLAATQALRDAFLAARPASSGTTFVFASPGVEFREVTADDYVIDPEHPEHFSRVLAALKARGLVSVSIVNGWAWETADDAQAVDSLTATDDTARLALTVLPAASLASAIGSADKAGLVGFTLLVREGAGWTGALAASASALHPALRMAWPETPVRAVRVTGGDAGRAASQLLAELRHAPSGLAETLYRDDVRYERRLASWRAGATLPTPLRKGGVYLVTGGLGALGYVLATHLAQRYQAKLCLLGRSELDAPRQARMDALRAAGADPMYLACDAGDEAALTNAVAQVRECFGALHGVFHCAGLVDGKPLREKSLVQWREALRAKVRGTLALDSATRSVPLDLLVLFSSTSALLGDFGDGDYAVGNRFLDEFMLVREGLRARGERAGRTVTIDWPLWREGAMHLNAGAERLYLETSGMRYLESAEGLACLEEILASGQSQAVVLPRQSTASKKPKATEPARAPAPAAIAAPGEDALEAELKQLVSGLLKIPVARLDPEENLGAFGFDSVGLTRFAQLLSRRFSITVTPTVFFAHSTLRDLRRHLDETHGPALRAQLSSTAPAAATGGDVARAAPVAERASRAVSHDEPIAIIGMGGIFPGGPDLESFWHLLQESRSAITEIPASRWDWRTHYGANVPEERRSNTKWGGFIDGLDRFDARFFRLSPLEAEEMDPQHRLFLQTCWSTLENAGYAVQELSGKKVGVFAGVQFKDYEQLMTARGRSSAHISTGNSHALLVNRVSYLLNLRGPSEAMDTACSSSLVAIHRAVQSLRSGECTMALAGGVSLMMDPFTFVGTSKLGVLSSEGRCKTFDAEANGYVRGEGVGTVLLKPLSKALEDGDHIHAVIRATAVNHGGKAASLTAPNSRAQAELLVDAYERAGIEPETLTYLEAHGTGTALGDPVEVQGILEAFQTLATRRGRALSETHFCALGSVKTNIGHLEPAAGIAGVLKVVLSMTHQTLPGNPELRQPNPLLRLEGTPLYLLRQTQPWVAPRDAAGTVLPRRAGISSFGYGGTNAHVVLEEAMPSLPETRPGQPGPQVFTLSARTPAQLQAYAGRFAEHLRHERATLSHEAAFANLLFTSQVGRSALKERLAVVVSTADALEAALRAFARGEPLPSHAFRGGPDAAAAEGTHFVTGEDALTALARNWVTGREVDWAAEWRTRVPGWKPRRVPLPSYPFESSQHWFEQRTAAPSPEAPAAGTAPVAAAAVSAEVVDRAAVSDRLRADLLAAARQVTKVPEQDLDFDEDLRELGFESITMIEFCKALTKRSGLEVKPDVFFDMGRPSLGALHRYLMERFAGTLATLARPGAAASSQGAVLAPPSTSSLEAREVRASAPARPEPVAIIGMAGAMPQSPDLDSFWEGLEAGRNLITEIPSDRWDWRKFYGDPAKEPGKTTVRWGGFVPDAGDFDAMFFGISAREAELMDPQQRLFLSTVWRAIENAGYRPSELSRGRTGLLVGVAANDYQELQRDFDLDVEAYTATGLAHSILANRISYLLNFNGPSEPVDTACSSSLVAIHRGVELLQAGRCDTVIAGGVNLLLNPRLFIAFSKAGMLSPDGQCKSFDKRANGYVRGEGVGAVVLKSLSRAEKDGDHILAVIRGTAINHGGRAASLTAPNTQAQADLLMAAYTAADVDPASVGYIEAHGTGTALGDPVEVNALKRAFTELHRRQGRTAAPRHYCGLGSVKTNIGHLETAAGIAGIFKVVMGMNRGLLPAHRNFEQLNPLIDLDDSPFFIVDRTQPWRRMSGTDGQSLPRRAGISSFGFGGVNAHVVLEEYVPATRAAAPAAVAGSRLVPLSAKTPEALTASVRQMVELLSRPAQEAPRDPHAEEVLRQGVVDVVARMQDVSPSDVDPAVDLADYGFDRVRLSVLAEALTTRFGVELDLEAVEDAGSVAAIAARLSSLRTPPAGQEGTSLDDLAFTLQEGREPFEERLAVVCSDVAGLLAGWRAFLDGRGAENVLRGRVRKSRDGAAEQERQAERARQCAREGRWTELAGLWVVGTEVDWSLGRAPGSRRRLALPGHPFARERYWISPREPRAVVASTAPAAPGESAFPSRLTGEEFYLRDHVVGGRAILPGVASLELGRAAGASASGRPVRRLRNILWVQPLVASPQPIEVRTEVRPVDGGLAYEVRTKADDGSPVIHAQGTIVLDAAIGEAPARVDLRAVRERCQAVLPRSDTYALFESRGMRYGPSLQTIQTLYSADREALAVLRLPDEARDAGGMVLHPSLMDAALQTVISFPGDSTRMYLPFAVETLTVHGELDPEGHAYARLLDEDRASRRFEVLLLDREGNVRVRFDNLSVRVLKAPTASVEADTSSRVLMVREWRRHEDAAPPAPRALDRVLVLGTGGPLEEALVAALQARGVGPERLTWVRAGDAFRKGPSGFELSPQEPEHFRQLVDALKQGGGLPQTVFHLWADGAWNVGEPSRGLKAGAVLHPLFHLSKALLEARPPEQVTVVHAFHGSAARTQPLSAAIGGFARTLRLENPRLVLRSVSWDDVAGGRDTWTREVAQLLGALDAPGGGTTETRFQAKDAWRPAYVPAIVPEKAVPLRRGGVYLVSGGAGGLGLRFAEHLGRTLGAKLVLAGRSELTPAVSARLEALRASGAQVKYVRADVSSREDVERWVSEARAAFGAIHGVLHAAGLNRDGFLLKKGVGDVDAVLAPKVLGTAYLDECLATEQLDFFALFSSATALLGNVGQADYGYANEFLNAFAEAREAMRQQGTRHGLTVSLNWQLWADGGMAVDADTGAWMFKQAGMRPLTFDVGVAAFEESLRVGAPVVGIFYGDRERILHAFEEEKAPQVSSSPAAPAPTGDAPRSERVIQYLKEVLARTSKTPVARIGADEPLEKYGLDSVLIMGLTRELEAAFGELSKTLFFEYQSLAELAAYFVASHADTLRKMGLTDAVEKAAPVAVPEVTGTVRAPLAVAARTLEATHRPGVREDIAIVGISGRYPEAGSMDELWENLKHGRDCIIEVPPERWDHSKFYDPKKNTKGKAYSKWGGFIRDVDAFDSLYFNISPAEARFMDPQERLFLEVATEALQDAGYTKAGLKGGRVGVYVGLMYSHYQLFAAEESLKGNVMALGFSYASIANRVSYHYDLRGPSLALDTMCSSSLTALHLACHAIWDGECDAALAGGVNVSIHPNKYIMLSEGMFSSSDGRCRSFGEGGDGYVPGEGVGAVLVKPLSKALADGDHIHGIVKGLAINHGGKTNGFSVPNPHAQAELIEDAWRKAGIDPRELGYLEAHGTGTSLGDPIEMTALNRAYRKFGQEKQAIPIGSVKSNVGHLESAAGMVGLSKVLLQMKHGQLVPSIHSSDLNPNIRFDDSPFYVQHEFARWDRRKDAQGVEKPRIAGLSSFGAGGSNAHVVLQEHVADAARAPLAAGPHLIVLSARSDERLRAYAARMARHFRGPASGEALADVAYSLQVGRDALDFRLALVVEDADALVEKLEAFAADGTAQENVFVGSAKRGDASAQPLDDEDAATLMQRWVEKGRLPKLAELWVRGADVAWTALPQARGARRVSLPPYPFARERHWFRPAPMPELGAGPSVLHPLLDAVDAALSLESGLVFQKTFRAEERVVAHHRVAGRTVVPGVALAEMAWAAGLEALGGLSFCLRVLVWLQPLAVGSGTSRARVHVKREKGDPSFEIFTGEGDARVVHAKGRYRLLAPRDGAPRVALDTLRDRLPRVQGPEAFYAGYASIGIEYGDFFRGVTEVRAAGDEALAWVRVPEGSRASGDGYSLHPTLADGALQAISALMPAKAPGTTTVPFSVEEVEVLLPLGEQVFAYVKRAGPDSFNVALINPQGVVCARLREVSIRSLRAAPQASAPVAAPVEGNMAGFFHLPVWVPSH